MIKQEDIIPVGKFQKTHALKGELNMITDIDSDYFNKKNPVIIENDGILVPYYIETLRPKGTTSYLVKISGIDTEFEASQFVNKEIYILRKDAQEWLGEDLFDESFIGYTIIDENTGKEIGIVESIEDSTTNILLIVETKEKEIIYIPLNEEFIISIDEDMQKVYMKLPEGLIDINK